MAATSCLLDTLVTPLIANAAISQDCHASYDMKILQPLSRSLPHGAWGRNFLQNVALDAVERYLDSVSIFSALSRASLYSQDFQSQLNRESGARGLFNEYARKVRTGDPLDILLYTDSKTYLPGDILTKVDRMSMAASLEARSPLLDSKLIEFVTTIPSLAEDEGIDDQTYL